MAVVKVVEVVSTSPHGFQQAVEEALAVSSKTLRNICGIDVVAWTCKVQDSRITEYRTTCKVAFRVESD